MPQIRNGAARRPLRRLAATVLTILVLGFQCHLLLVSRSSSSTDATGDADARRGSDSDHNGNADGGGYLAWLLDERDRSVHPMQLQLHHRGQSGLGHQLVRLSCVYHLAMLYKIPRIWLASNPMCGGHIYTIHNFLLGPHNLTAMEVSSLMVDVPYAGRPKNVFEDRVELPDFFPNLAFVNETSDEIAGGNSYNRYVSVNNDVKGYDKGRNVHLGSALEEMIKHDYWGKEASDYQMYEQLMLLFGNQHADAIRNLMDRIDFDGHTVFGLHIRTGNGEGGDFTAKGRGMSNLDEWVVYAMHLLCDYQAERSRYFVDKPLMLYVGTDTASVIEKLRSASDLSCGIPVTSAAQAYPKDGEGVSFEAFVKRGQGDCLDGWRDMLLDMYMFTRCNTVLAGTYSSFTQAAPLSFTMQKARMRNRQRTTPAANTVHPHYFCDMGTDGRRMECFDTLSSWLRRNATID